MGDRKPKRKGGRPSSRPAVETKQLGYDEPRNFDDESPVFCLRHLHTDFSVRSASLSPDKRADFAMQLEKLSSLQWKQIKLAPRHGLGFERLPVKQLEMTMPPAFQDEESVFVFRYSGKLPMAGVRRGATLHLVAIEPEFGVLYDHGN